MTMVWRSAEHAPRSVSSVEHASPVWLPEMSHDTTLFCAVQPAAPRHGVAIMTPLADDPVVQDAVIARVSAEVLSRIKVEDLTDQAVEALIGRSMPSVLAERLRLLSAPLEQAMTTYVEESVERLVRSEQFRATWEAANRAGHAQLLGLINCSNKSQASPLVGRRAWGSCLMIWWLPCVPCCCWRWR